MKIAFDYQAFTYQSYGGISRYYSILANELLKHDQEVRVFAGLHRNHYLYDLPSQVVSGYKLSKYPPRTGSAIQLLNHCVGQAQVKSWNPDIIHETYYSSLPRLKTNAVRVTTVYDMIHELFSKQFSKHDKMTEWKRATFSRVDHILSISESTKRDLIQLFGVSEEKISVVHLGVDLTAFEKSTSNILNNQKPYLLYVGLRNDYKNFVGLIKAFASSSLLKLEFNLIAFGGGAFTSSELQLIKECGLNETQVHQTSGDDSKLADLYACATAFIYPSLYEGFGLPPLEAMASGCPVVSSNTSSMPEVIKRAGEYFNPTDTESIRNAIERVVFSPERQAELIALGYENIKYFSWKKCANETLGIYQKMIGKV